MHVPRLTVALALALTCATAPGAQALEPFDLRCEATPQPVGVDEPFPELSWLLAADHRAARQTAWHILVATSPEILAQDRGDAWDSGRVTTDDTVHVPYHGLPVPPSTTRWWKVRVWDENGQVSAWSTNAAWTTGLLTAGDWQARWITAPVGRGLPVFRREFTLARPVTQALIHVTGLGHYELTLDGEPVGDRFLDPAWSAYEQTVYYASHDVTARLREPGPHALGVQLGKGFYRTTGDRRIHGVKADRPLRLRLQLELRHADGSSARVLSDSSWRTTEGPITHSAILGGEDHDARRLDPAWNRVGFDDSTWSSAAETNGPGGTLRATLAPPMTRHETFSAVSVEEPKPGSFVYDFGQNAAAIPRLRVRGKAGQTVHLTPAEQRHGMTPRRNDGHGLVNPAGVGSPCFFEYTLRGDAEETWSPRFTYSGFQYLQVDGAVPAGRPNPEGKPEVLELQSVRIGSSAVETGTFQCSNPLLNDIDRLIAWAVRANLAHVLTDCPHREKLGWLEVSYLMGPSILGRFDAARVYAKISRDCAEAQAGDGLVPTVAPAYPAFSGGFAFTPEWGAAAVVNPWLLHQWSGDRRTLERLYPTMRGFVDYLRATAHDLVPVPGLGDWYDYGHGKPVGASQFTSPELSAMATFHRCTTLVSASAHVLGRASEAAYYATLAEEIARAFEARWSRSPDQYLNAGSPQTANSMAIVSGIAAPDRIPVLIEGILRDLTARGNQQTAGDIGHEYLLQALAEHGHSERIFTFTTRTNLGSYGFIARNGWTSLPEAWDADTGASMNHCMLGHLQEWLLGWVAGIRPDPDPQSAGFRRFVVDPQPVGDLAWASGTLTSVRGRIETHWRRDAREFSLELTVPPNTVAQVRLPAPPTATLREGDRTNDIPGVRLLSRDTRTATLEVTGGRYHFHVRRQP